MSRQFAMSLTSPQQVGSFPVYGLVTGKLVKWVWGFSKQRVDSNRPASLKSWLFPNSSDKSSPAQSAAVRLAAVWKLSNSL